MKHRISCAAFALALAAGVTVGFARPGGHVEVGDAPYGFATGAQHTVGTGNIEFISGSTNQVAPIGFFNEVWDCYYIIIKDRSTFRATVNSGLDPLASITGTGQFPGTDSRMVLMDASGQPLLINDDTGVAPTTLSSTLSTPQSYAISGISPLGVVTANASTVNIVDGNLYILAIGSYNSYTAHDNLDTTFTQTIDNPGSGGVGFRDLGGRIAGAPVSDVWIGSTLSTFNYTIRLRGASFSQDIPEPATLGLLAIGGIGLVRRRR